MLKEFITYPWFSPHEWLSRLSEYVKLHRYFPSVDESWLKAVFTCNVKLTDLTSSQRHILQRNYNFYSSEFFCFSKLGSSSGYVSKSDKGLISLYMYPRYQGFYSQRDYFVEGFPTAEFTKTYPAFISETAKADLISAGKKLNVLKREQTMLAKYGAKYAEQVPVLRDKRLSTTYNRYGTSDISKVPEISEKRKATCLARYGSEYILSSNKFRASLREQYLSNRTFSKFFQQLQYRDLSLITPLDELKSLNFNDMHFITKCLVCGYQFENRVLHGTIKNCPKCYKQDYRSRRELVLEQWLQSIGVVVEHGYRIIAPYDIDLYLPEFKLGFEFNGLYWHCGLFHGKDYHKTKTELALQKGIKLYHLWEDESLEFCQSFILSVLGRKPKIYARCCEVKVLDKSVLAKVSHRQSSARSSITVGLIYNGKVESEISFLNRGSYWENSRYVASDTYQIIGGFAKMLSYVKPILKQKHSKLITYCDRDLTPDYKDSVYIRNGFQFIKDSGCEMRYYLLKSYKELPRGVYPRQFFQKHKLVNYDFYEEGLTEQENLAKICCFPVYNSGCWKYILEL